MRLHARDAVSADRDLREALGLRREALGGGTPAGALVFTCNGRGEAMFGTPDHDALTLDEELAGAPAAGFFAAGEIGPVGGDPLPARVHRHCGSLPAVNLAGTQRSAHRRDRWARARHRAAPARGAAPSWC